MLLPPGQEEESCRTTLLESIGTETDLEPREGKRRLQGEEAPSTCLGTDVAREAAWEAEVKMETC